MLKVDITDKATRFSKLIEITQTEVIEVTTLRMTGKIVLERGVWSIKPLFELEPGIIATCVSGEKTGTVVTVKKIDQES